MIRKNHMEQEPQSSDEFPQGMKFTRESIEDPYALGITYNKGTLYPETCEMTIQEARAARQARGRAVWKKDHDNSRTLGTLESLSRGPLNQGRL